VNFYKHHLGDYDAATAHLNWTEDAAYTKLLRVYYRRELPIPVEIESACRLVRAKSKEQKTAVKTVLGEFFQLLDDGWHNKRADEEIKAYQNQSCTNRKIARERWESTKRTRFEYEQSTPESSVRTDFVHLTKNQIPEPEEPKPSCPNRPKASLNGAFVEFWKAYPRKEAKGRAEKAWISINPNETLTTSILKAIQAQRQSGCLTPATAQDGRSLIPLPASWLNAKRWLDEGVANQSLAEALGFDQQPPTSDSPSDLDDDIPF